MKLRAASCSLTAAFMLLASYVYGADWPQLRGVATDGTSTELISTNWPAGGPTLIWTNGSLTNGFGCVVVSGGRAFTQISKMDGSTRREYCVAVDAVAGTNIWARPIDTAPWDPSYNNGAGGAGNSPYDCGDGPRSTPSVAGDRVVTLSGYMHLVCMNVTNGSVIWSNNLVSSYGATYDGSYQSGASPCLDSNLVYVCLGSSTNSLVAFRLTDGGKAWSLQTDKATHTTPVIATIAGVRQVIFATKTGLVSVNCSGTLLWRYGFSISNWMGASPLVYSNIVYCTAGYGKGTAAVRVTVTNSTWTATQLYKTSNFQSMWMTPVCYQGYVYSLVGSGAYLTASLSCIELSTGTLQWDISGFGQGGLILVGTNLLVLSEDGQLVLVQATPDAYTEVARYQALQFSESDPGKCWNNPTFSNGRIYARGTRGAVALDASVTTPPALRLLSPKFVTGTQLELSVATADGTPLTSNRLAKIQVHATNTLGALPTTWPVLTNPWVLGTNGIARMTNIVNPSQMRQFYETVELP